MINQLSTFLSPNPESIGDQHSDIATSSVESILSSGTFYLHSLFFLFHVVEYDGDLNFIVLPCVFNAINTITIMFVIQCYLFFKA